MGMPIKFVQNPVTFDQPAPAVGEQNAEIYGRLLGIDEAKLQTLKKQGVI